MRRDIADDSDSKEDSPMSFSPFSIASQPWTAPHFLVHAEWKFLSTVASMFDFGHE